MVMKTKAKHYFEAFIILITLNFPLNINAQQNDTTLWSLTDCIDFALEQNIEIRGSLLNIKSGEVSYNQAKSQKLPSVNAAISQNFNWQKGEDTNGNSMGYEGGSNNNYQVSSSVSLFNGFKLSNKVEQAGIELESGRYNSETIKENVSLQILNAFLHVLYTEEQLKNAEKQIESTTEQLQLAEERLNLSIISRSDYLQVKSELASEKLTLANAKSSYDIAMISLMQLMELPVDTNFDIIRPDLEKELNQMREPDAQQIYQQSLGIKPQIKNAELNKQSAEYDEKIAKADFYPSVFVNAGLGTGYTSAFTNLNYFDQLNNSINPSVGLSVSIPIFQKNQVKNNVKQAQIGIENASLNEINIKNQLRKNIEQACTDVTSAQMQFEASKEKYEATLESYNLAEEKFINGLINSVDFLIEKNKMIIAESDLLQSRFNLVFSYKIIDFYAGNPITL
jgi:outer membrane protein